jgi:hypothetical protein
LPTCSDALRVSSAACAQARFATGMDLAMRIVQWLSRPAADFVYLARW